MTITEARITAAPGAANLELHSAAAELTSAAAQLAADASSLPAGHRRRALKLAAQLRATARLFANGDRSPDGAPVAAASALSRRAATATGSLAATDSAVARARVLARSAHHWRGHTRSLPAT